jgi:A/G-specific adenine glycosylase
MNHNNCESLLHWYSRNRRNLPWRETLDVYPVMVSEFMLQQTTVAAVTPKFYTWLQHFPDFQALAQADQASVLDQWSGLGYYQRARRLHQAAREVVRLGQTPDTYEGLIKLPGVGPYTAAAIASICFGRPKLAIDTNVVRVLFRYHALKSHPLEKQALEEIRRETEPRLQSNDPGDLNQALMELGATLCKVKEPACLQCPLKSGCRGRRSQGGPTDYPLSTKRKKPTDTPGRALLCVRTSDSSVLLVKGTSLGLLSLLFQPPILFSEAESQETFHSALTSMVQFVDPAEREREWQVKYGISGRRLLLDCWLYNLEPHRFGELKTSLKERGLSVAQLSPEQTNKNVPVSSLTRKLLQKCWESP